MRRPVSQVEESITGPLQSEVRRCDSLYFLDRGALEERGENGHTTTVDASSAIPLRGAGRSRPVVTRMPIPYRTWAWLVIILQVRLVDLRLSAIGHRASPS